MNERFQITKLLLLVNNLKCLLKMKKKNIGFFCDPQKNCIAYKEGL